MLAIVPVALVAIGALRHPHLSRVRWPAALPAATYTTPLVIWMLRDDPAQSLSKDMSPVFIPLIVAAVAVLLIRTYAKGR